MSHTQHFPSVYVVCKGPASPVDHNAPPLRRWPEKVHQAPMGGYDKCSGQYPQLYTKAVVFNNVCYYIIRNAAEYANEILYDHQQRRIEMQSISRLKADRYCQDHSGRLLMIKSIKDESQFIAEPFKDTSFRAITFRFKESC